MTEDQIKMASTDSLDSCSVSSLSDEDYLLFGEHDSDEIVVSEDDFGGSASELGEELSSGEDALDDEPSLDSSLSAGQQQGAGADLEDALECIFKRSDGDASSSCLPSLSAGLKDDSSTYGVADILVLEPYLHYDGEFESKDLAPPVWSSGLAADLGLQPKGTESSFVVNGNKRIFQEGLIELSSSSDFGHPSSISHDGSGLLFLGTIRGFCLIRLETGGSSRCIVIDPVNGVSSKITSISVSRAESKDFVFLSTATLDGSLSLWRLNTAKLREFLMEECDPERVSDDIPPLAGSSRHLGGARVCHVTFPKQEQEESSSGVQATRTGDRHLHSELATLLTHSPKHVRGGILNHEFIDIRSRESAGRLALFISDMQGNLYVTLLAGEPVSEDTKDESKADTQTESGAKYWKVDEKIFLYSSEEDIMHQFRALPPPPLKRHEIPETAQSGRVGPASRREIHPMDHYHFYLVAGRRGFLLISMLPHPALCKVVDVVDDLRKESVDLADSEIAGVYLSWLRPAVVPKGTSPPHSDRTRIRIIASISRFVCVYEIASFEEFGDSDEVRVELRLSAVWAMFDSVGGVLAFSENIIALLMGLRGVYIYQILEDYQGFNSTTRVDGDNRLKVVPSQTLLGEEDERFRQKKGQDALKGGVFESGSRSSREAYLIVKSRPVSVGSHVGEMLVCIHRYVDNDRKLFVVSQMVTNDLQESVDLFGQSFVLCRAGRSARTVLLLNDRVVSLVLSFKSWIPLFEREFNSNMDKIKGLLYDDLAWTRLAASFIALYENRLPSLQTWTSIDKGMVLNMIKNILNSLVDSVVGELHSKVERGLFETYVRQVLRLIIDSGIRLGLWDYLFEELIPVIQSYKTVRVSTDSAEGFGTTGLLDYYLTSVVRRFIRGEISWELLEGDFLRLLIDWYRSRVLRLEKLRTGAGLDKETAVDAEVGSVLSEVQFVMTRVLKADLETGGGSLWLVFVPLFKKYGFWRSYILLYLLSGRDAADLLRRMVTQLCDHLVERLSSGRCRETGNGGGLLLEAIDVESQRLLEESKTVQSYYHYVYSLIFRETYPFDEEETACLEDCRQQSRVPLSLDTEEFVGVLCGEVRDGRLGLVRSSCDLLILVSPRFYVYFLAELRRRKKTLLSLAEVTSEGSEDRGRRIVRFEKLYLVLEDKLELFVRKVLRMKRLGDSADSKSPLEEEGSLDPRTEILQSIAGEREGSAYGRSVSYLLGNYLNWLILNMGDYSIGGETDYRLVIRCFFKIVEELSDAGNSDGGPEVSGYLSSLVKRLEYNLIMAIIASNKNNEGMNFLDIFLSCVGEDSQSSKDCNKVEMNQSLSRVLKRHSLYNLSLYLSIQVYDLESILDMYSNKHFINGKILRELYIMDEENNNILFSLNYILSTIEKGISHKVFDHDQVFVLITRYTDLLIKIDSLDTVDLIIHILCRCLDDKFNSTSRHAVSYYVQKINSLDLPVQKILLGSILCPETRGSPGRGLQDREAGKERSPSPFQLSDKSIYKDEMGLRRWNELINQLIPQYLESYLGERRTNDSSILGILDHWYRSSVRCDELLSTPFERCFILCKQYNNEYGMVYLSQIFSVNPSLRSSAVCQGLEHVSRLCISRFGHYLSRTRGLLEGRLRKEVFLLSARRTSKDKTILYSLDLAEESDISVAGPPRGSRRDLYSLWDELLEFASFIYLFCFTNYSSNGDWSHGYRNESYIVFYKDVLKTLLAEMESVSQRFGDQVFMELAEELLLKREGQHSSMRLPGAELVIALYYILACLLLGNRNYLYLLDKYLIKFGFLSDLLFNSKLNRLFPNPITSYYTFARPILQLLISEAKSSQDTKTRANYPCRFWRHLALEMMDTKLFVDKCSDEVGQLFQSDLLHIFNSLTSTIRRAVVVQFNDHSSPPHLDGRTQDRNEARDKYLRYGLRSSCCYCGLPLSVSGGEDDSRGREPRGGSHSYSVSVLSDGVHDLSSPKESNSCSILGARGGQQTIRIEEKEQSTKGHFGFNNGSSRDYDDMADEEEELSNTNKLHVFHCGNVLHKRCFYGSTSTQFGSSSGEKGEVHRQVYLGDKHPNNSCLHQYRVSFS